MKRKFIAFLAALVSVIGCTSLSFSVSAGAILQDDEIIEDTTEVTTTTTVNNITEEEFNQRSEQLQEQINEIYRLFEENGYNIEGITGNVEGLNGEVQGLHTSLDNLYSLIESLKTTSNNKSSVSPTAAPQTTPPKKEPSIVTTTVTAVHAEPQTEPNGYLIEKVEKTPEKRDFITVTTRDGHIFYIVIDYEGENKNVYFLNTVDTADLNRLLESGSTAMTEAENIKKDETETKTEAAESEKETDKSKMPKKKNSNLILYIIGVIAVVVFVFIAKKKMSKGKKNDYDDEIDNDEFTEEEPEIYIDESKEDDYDE